MITYSNVEGISPIILSVLLIAYLMIVELGNEKTKKVFKPFIIVLIVIFSILAFKSIYSTYSKIK
jgi:hydrogenase-4 membrane subunit HyfE